MSGLDKLLSADPYPIPALVNVEVPETRAFVNAAVAVASRVFSAGRASVAWEVEGEAFSLECDDGRVIVSSPMGRFTYIPGGDEELSVRIALSDTEAHESGKVTKISELVSVTSELVSLLES